MGPIDYTGLLQQLDVTPLQNGLALRQRNQAAQAEQQIRQQTVQLAQSKFKAEQTENADYRTALTGYLANPTPEALMAISSRFPDHQKALSDGAEAYNTSQRNDLVTAAASSLGALSAGKNDIAIKTLEERRAGLRRAGINDDQTSAVIDLVKQGKTKEAQAYLGYALSGLIGPQHASSMLQTLGVGAKADDAAADNARADRALDLREKRDAATDARAERREQRADAREARADRREARLAAGTSSDGYEWRMNPTTGKLQRRKR